jgi:hypothetical protein
MARLNGAMSGICPALYRYGQPTPHGMATIGSLRRLTLVAEGR